MSHTKINPEGLHDPVAFGYSHVVDTSIGLVFVAGQYASDRTGQVTSTDFAEQVQVSFANLRIALTAVGLDFGDVVQLRLHIYEYDLDKLAAVGRVVSGIWGAKPPAQTVSGVAALALPEMLFEVDAVAVRA